MCVAHGMVTLNGQCQPPWLCRGAAQAYRKQVPAKPHQEGPIERLLMLKAPGPKWQPFPAVGVSISRERGGRWALQRTGEGQDAKDSTDRAAIEIDEKTRLPE